MCSIVLYVFYSVSDYFTGEGINSAVIYHLIQGAEGAEFSAYSGLIATSIIVILMGIFLSYWLIARACRRSEGGKTHAYGSMAAVVVSLLLNPAIGDLSGLMMESSAFAMNKKGTSEFYKSYRQPKLELVSQKKNLVFIYAESLERTYFDESLFPGLITGLKELEARSTTFTNVRQIDHTSWTIAALVSSQCGLPLFTPYGGNSMSGMGEFLPSARCLSDFLSDEGYYMSYYGGAKITFAGKKSFFKTHSYDEYKGWQSLVPLINKLTYAVLVPWGLYDDDLLDLAYKRFNELSATKENFALMTLTLDTHGMEGRPSHSCKGISYGDGSNPVLNVMACSDKLITDFVKKILNSPHASNTVIVIASDHLSMKNTATDLLAKGDRSNIFMVIEPEGKPAKIDKYASTMDIASTILPFIGFKGEIGLGRNIAGKAQTEEEIRYIQDNLLSWKPDIFQLWDFPRIKRGIKFDLSKLTIHVDDKVFNVPALVALTPELETTFSFSYQLGGELVDNVLNMDEDTYYLLFDTCTNTNRIVNNFRNKAFCLLAGSGGLNRDVSSIIQLTPKTRTFTLTPDDIRHLAQIPSKGKFRPSRIAHAGGGLDGTARTNSFEALDQNIRKGYEYFEIDFNFTSDGHLVCIHDWGYDFKHQFGLEPEGVPTLAEFKALVRNNAKYEMCTLESLVPWLKENAEAKIITDVKGKENLRALKLIARSVPEFKSRIIPQLYYPESYKVAKGLGYEQIIWTLYRYKGSNNDVLNWVDKFKGPFAITMPKERANSPLPVMLAKKHVPTYVHTINNREHANIYLNSLGVTELYTDFLAPGESLIYSMPTSSTK
jgi:phosphoglycerol transferase